MDAPNIIPDDSFQPIQGEPAQLIRSHPHGNQCDLTFYAASGSHNLRISRRHWEFVQATALNHACLVVDFKLAERGPRHLYWSFPPEESGDYKHWTYMQSSEIADSLVQCILESELGQCSLTRGARFGYI